VLGSKNFDPSDNHLSKRSPENFASSIQTFSIDLAPGGVFQTNQSPGGR